MVAGKGDPAIAGRGAIWGTPCACCKQPVATWRKGAYGKAIFVARCCTRKMVISWAGVRIGRFITQLRRNGLPWALPTRPAFDHQLYGGFLFLDAGRLRTRHIVDVCYSVLYHFVPLGSEFSLGPKLDGFSEARIIVRCERHIMVSMDVMNPLSNLSLTEHSPREVEAHLFGTLRLVLSALFCYFPRSFPDFGDVVTTLVSAARPLLYRRRLP
jgi:hypothetical protein